MKNQYNNTVRRFRILTADYKIKFAGTGLDSWFFDLETAKSKVDDSKDEMIYEFNFNGDRLYEIL